MYHKQGNKTAIQSQHMITDALFSLMKQKSFQQITVTEICREAAIGRKTFYRNFDWKEDVVDFQLDLLCEQYRGEIVGMSTAQQLRHHLEFVRQHSEWFIALYRNGLHQMVSSKFAALLPETMPRWTDDPVEQEYRSQYIVAGVEAVERVWVERGFQESVDEVVQIVERAHEKQVPSNGEIQNIFGKKYLTFRLIKYRINWSANADNSLLTLWAWAIKTIRRCNQHG